MGRDAARLGSDRSALTKRRGPAVFEIRTRAGLDLMQLTAAIVAQFNSTQMHLRPVVILVDSIGLGLGAVERLRELKLAARWINASESLSMKGARVNLRAEPWFTTTAWRVARLQAGAMRTFWRSLPLRASNSAPPASCV